MPAHRSGGPLTPPSPLNDDGLDREVAALMAVKPSAEFLARVRMRIASEAAPPAWRLSRMFVVAGACAVAIALALTGAQLSRTAVPPDPDRVRPPSRPFADLSLVLPSIAAAPFAGAPLATAASSRRRVEKPTPEMRAIMQSNAGVDAALRAHTKEKDYGAIVQDAATYKQNFAYIAVFWANQQADAALTISTRGLAAAIELEAAALGKDDGAVEKAMAALADTCDACHKEHREQLADKTYAIRL
jgi:hypothetical protein